MRSARLLLSSLGGCLTVLLMGAGVLAQTGVQVTPDGRQHLISKDVGNERWAITYNLDDQTVTGNVFFPDGREPAFVWCQPMSESDCTVSLQCFGADKCASVPCSPDAWRLISTVQLPLQFFLPPQASTLDLTGTFAGSGSDSSGPGTMILELTQNGTSVSGQVSIASPSLTVSGHGWFSGTLTCNTLSFTAVIPVGGFSWPFEMCEGAITGTAQVTTSTITGTYTGYNSCSGTFGNGYFTVERPRG